MFDVVEIVEAVRILLFACFFLHGFFSSTMRQYNFICIVCIVIVSLLGVFIPEYLISFERMSASSDVTSFGNLVLEANISFILGNFIF